VLYMKQQECGDDADDEVDELTGLFDKVEVAVVSEAPPAWVTPETFEQPLVQALMTPIEDEVGEAEVGEATDLDDTQRCLVFVGGQEGGGGYGDYRSGGEHGADVVATLRERECRWRLLKSTMITQK
jgi:hypothetical protein